MKHHNLNYMKTKLTILALLISTILVAQNGINYKALIRDANGNIVNSQGIDIEFTIEMGGEDVYSESHQITTDNNGIAIAVIGAGSVISGNFNTLDWKRRDAELNVQIDLGNGLVDMGNSTFNAVPYAISTLKPQGLEALDEGNGIGWRLAGSNPNNHGNIGQNALDFSEQPSPVLLGAIGELSVAFGRFSEASGYSSFAMGDVSRASGEQSFAFGENVTTTGDFSVAMGFSNLSNGDYSASFGRANIVGDYAFAAGRSNQVSGESSSAIGTSNLVSGDFSTAIGYSTEASGLSSTAMGRSTQAEAYISTAIGRYNVGGGNATTWNDFDSLFEIGNGSSDSNRNNALTVYKSGNHVINSSSTGLRINSESIGLFIPNCDSSGIFISNPGGDGIAISNPGDNGIEISNSDGEGIEITNSGGDGMVISNSDGDGIEITNSGSNGILVSGSQTFGASITGNDAGIRARASVSQNPDIILRGNSSANASDDGIIASDPNYAGSDIYLRSNDALVVDLDNDDNGSGSFIVRNGDDDDVFTINESGNVNIDGRLRIGNVNIERVLYDSLDFLRVNSSIMPNEDAQHILGAGTNRWINVWAVDGTINTSDRREKKNIEDLNYGLKEVLQMQPVSFNWKNKNIPDAKIGLIAQDLQALVPEVVKSHTWEKDEVTGALTKKELERLGVYYSDLVPVLINAIKEQNKIIESQVDALKTAKNNYEVLLSRIEILETNTSN